MFFSVTLSGCLLRFFHPLPLATEPPYHRFRLGASVLKSPNQAYHLRVLRTSAERRQLYTRPHPYPARTGGRPVNKILVTADHKVTTRH